MARAPRARAVEAEWKRSRENGGVWGEVAPIIDQLPKKNELDSVGSAGLAGWQAMCRGHRSSAAQNTNKTPTLSDGLILTMAEAPWLWLPPSRLEPPARGDEVADGCRDE